MKNIFVLALLVSFTGCTSMQTVSSVNKNEESGSNYRYYDSNSEIRYQVSNTSDFLYLSFNTTNKASIMKILETGLSIYLDAQGKKKKDTYIQYPLNRMGNMQRQGPPPSNEGGRPPKMDLANMIRKMPRTAIYYTNETNHRIDLNSDKSELEIEIKEVNGGIVYTVKIPLNKISNTLNLEDGFSIGVESGEFEAPSQGGQGMQNGQGGGGPGGAGGGPGGNGGGPGGRGDGPPGGGGGQQSSEMTVPIKFWFRVDLFTGN